MVDYASVPIGGADLSPLMLNQRLRELYLGQCGLTEDDINILQGAKTLEVISTHGNALKPTAVQRLIKEMPNLRLWHGDLFTLDRIRIEDHQTLEGLVERSPEEKNEDRAHLAYCTALRLKNLPQWKVPIRIDAGPSRHLTIENLPQLESLVINSPVCDDAILSGLTGLKSIAAGGPSLDDDMMADWANYSNLNAISLYGTSITKAGFRKLLDGRKPSTIDIRQASLDDQAILSIDPASLASVTLHDTQVSVAAIRHVLKSPMLFHLDIDGISLAPDVTDSILSRSQLIHLGMDGSNLEPRQINRAAMLPAIERMTLRNFHLDSLTAAAIASGGRSSLKHLSLIDSTADGPALKALLDQMPYLQLKIVRTEIPAVMEGKLFADGRLLDEQTEIEMTYCRGPNGFSLPIIPAGSMPGSAMRGLFSAQFGWAGMRTPETFDPMPSNQFLKLNPVVFFPTTQPESFEFTEEAGQ